MRERIAGQRGGTGASERAVTDETIRLCPRNFRSRPDTKFVASDDEDVDVDELDFSEIVVRYVVVCVNDGALNRS